MKLINLSDLIDMLYELNLGVWPASAYVPDKHDMVVDDLFFRPFQHPAGDFGASPLWGNKAILNQSPLAS